MSERRTYTLDDGAVDCLKVVPKDRNSQFVSDLIVSFFEGKDLLSDSDWGFLSSEVEGVHENGGSESSSPIDLEKARLRGVLSRLESLDLSSYQAFCDFLALPEVRVGGVFDFTLGRLYQEHSEEWDFLGLIPSSDVENHSADTVEFYLKERVSELEPDFDFLGFLGGLFGAVSSLVLRDLIYQERFGLTYSEYVKRREEEGEAKKKVEDERLKALKIEKERRRALEVEKERMEALKIEEGKADFISSVEADLRGRLLKGGCSGSSFFSGCRGKLSVGYRVDPRSWHYSDSVLLEADVEYTPFYCEKHLLGLSAYVWTSAGHLRSVEDFNFVAQE